MKIEPKIVAIVSVAVALVLYGCSKFEYSNYQVNLDEKFKNTNAINIDRLPEVNKDTITIAVIGDSQRFYDSTGEIIKKINATPNIDFVAHTGDLVDFGMQQEYEWMHKALSKLHYPYMAVVGNHDLIANGGNVYRHMYGDFNFSFTFSGTKFIYINTNSREFNFDVNVPDIAWLDHELADTSNYNKAILVCHVSHINEDFNNDLRDDFIATLRKYKKVRLSINGHFHNFSFTPAQEDNIAFLNTYSTKKEKFILLKIWKDDFSFEIIE
jgi:3',5'-cyclic AMP phosphodiesterase CpdA